jgi:hypothetical protein
MMPAGRAQWLNEDSIDKALSTDHAPGPVSDSAAHTAMMDAQYSQPPFGRKMK